MPVSGLNSALNGIQKGYNNLHKHADYIASADMLSDENSETLPESLVGLKSAELQVKASMQVIKSVDDMIGTLLDVTA